jgi:hypothetical protein
VRESSAITNIEKPNAAINAKPTNIAGRFLSFRPNENPRPSAPEAPRRDHSLGLGPSCRSLCVAIISHFYSP